MKSIKYLAIVLAGMFMITACQKDYSVETGSIGGLAQGTLKDTLGDCNPITLRGLYFVDSTLTDSNYAIVQVNIATPGSYVIFTDVQNGFSFKDSGYFNSAGLINVKLKGSGKPIAPVTSDFTVTFGNSFCLFSVPALPNTSTPAAVFTLSGSGSNCTNAVVQGTYTAGTSLNSTNTATVQVNVTTPGSYVISTTQTNGISFVGNGTFTTAGVQTVLLRGNGTPTTAGATSIPISAGGTNCSFTVNVVAGNTNINQADSAWQFTQGSKTFHGTIDSVAFSKPSGSPLDVLQLYGLTFNTGDSLFVLGIGMTSSAIQSGTYNTNTFAAFTFIDSTNARIYEASPQTVTPPVNLTIVLTYDAATKIVSGTFSGTAQNAAGASVTISGGKFRAKMP